MREAMWQATEQDSSLEVKNALISERITRVMQGIYHEWLTSTVLWMKCSNLHLMWK